jgi:hypothetical protein
MSLDDIRWRAGRPTFPHTHTLADEGALDGYLAVARRLFASIDATSSTLEMADELGLEFERLRWFPLPGEVVLRTSTGGTP